MRQPISAPKEREARAASSLEHPTICSIYEFGEHEGQAFIVMPLLQGQTIRDMLATSGALPEKQVVELASQIAHGLQAAHWRALAEACVPWPLTNPSLSVPTLVIGFTGDGIVPPEQERRTAR